MSRVFSHQSSAISRQHKSREQRAEGGVRSDRVGQKVKRFFSLSPLLPFQVENPTKSRPLVLVDFRLGISLSLLLLFSFLFPLSSAFAQEQETPPALTLEQALSLAPNVDADVISARTDVAAAERDLQRVSNDPLALRLEKLQAEQALASEQDSLEAALVANRLDVTDKFFAALEADETLANALKQQLWKRSRFVLKQEPSRRLI
jgi:hypothetical protein